jgi:aspartate-alanine antiporter
MTMLEHIVSTAPEAFIFAAVAIGSYLGRFRIRGFAIGATACTLVVAVVLGQLGEFAIPPILRSVLFALFVFSIGYRAGPEFFASLSFKTLSQVALGLSIGLVGLITVLIIAHVFELDAGTAAGLGAGSLTQTSMMGTAVGALTQLGLPEDVMKQRQANVAAGYAVTYVCGYILVLLFIPLIAPRLMGINLKEEAKKLEAALMGGAQPVPVSLIYRKFQARAYAVTHGAGRSLAQIEGMIGRRAVIEKIFRADREIELTPTTVLNAGDRVVVVGPSSAIVIADEQIGPEIEGEHLLRAIEGEVVEVLVTSRAVHGQSIADFAEQYKNEARGVFMRSLLRHGQEVPITPRTRLYVGDVATLVGTKGALAEIIPVIGQPIRAGDTTDIAFIAAGLAVGLLVGLLTLPVGPVMLTLGGGGGALVAGLVCGWLRSRRPTAGAFPPAARQALSDIGLGGFVACIGLANGPAALAAIEAHGWTLLMAGVAVTLVPMIAGTLIAYHMLRMNPVIICGALSGAMTVDAAVAGCCDVADSQTPLLGVAVPYAVSNVFLTVLGPLIVALV